jgi:hypothetical protein
MVAGAESFPLSFFLHQNRLLLIWGGLFCLLLPGHLLFLHLWVEAGPKVRPVHPIVFAKRPPTVFRYLPFSIQDMHNRMPLIIKSEVYAEWLDPENKDTSKIEELLKTKYMKELRRYAVFRLVNRVENNSKECIEPLTGWDDKVKSFLRKVCPWLVFWFFTAIANALRVPTKTARFLALVRSV